jgi:hypothetical protein
MTTDEAKTTLRAGWLIEVTHDGKEQPSQQDYR